MTSPAPGVRHARRLLALIALCAGLTGCGCPGLFNKNCSMDVLVALDEPVQEINDGYSFQVSVVALTDGDPAASMTNGEWIRGQERSKSQHRNVDFSVQSGRISVAENAADTTVRAAIAADGKSIDIDLKSLGNPNEGGRSRLAVFADLDGQLDEGPLLVSYPDIKANGWRVRVAIGPDGPRVDLPAAAAAN